MLYLHMTQSIITLLADAQYVECRLGKAATKEKFNTQTLTGMVIDMKKLTINGKLVSNCTRVQPATPTIDGECIPTKVFFQQMVVQREWSKYFPGGSWTPDRKSKRLLFLAAPLAMYAYNHNLDVGDRIYGGSVTQIIRFNYNKMGDTGKKGETIDVGEFSGYRWESYDGKLIVVAVRGTDYPKNWGVNFNAKAVKVKLGECQGKAHGGIYNLVFNNWHYWNQLLRSDDIRQGYTLMLTGHSLGGAIVQQMMFQLFCRDPVKIFGQSFDLKKFRKAYVANEDSAWLRVYTFGAPATFDKDLRKAVKDRLIEYEHMLTFINGRDRIPRLGNANKQYFESVLNGGVAFQPAWFPLLSPSATYVSRQLSKTNVRLCLRGIHDLPMYLRLGKDVKVANPNAGSLGGLDIWAHATAISTEVSAMTSGKAQGWFCQSELQTIYAYIPDGVIKRRLIESSGYSYDAFYAIMIAMFLSFIMSLFINFFFQRF